MAADADRPSMLRPLAWLAAIAGIFFAGRWSKSCKAKGARPKLDKATARKPAEAAAPVATPAKAKGPTLPAGPAAPSA